MYILFQYLLGVLNPITASQKPRLTQDSYTTLLQNGTLSNNSTFSSENLLLLMRSA